MRTWGRAVALCLVTLTTSLACAAVGGSGEASSYLIVDSMQAASGARPTAFAGTLGSDVQTFVNVSVAGVQQRVPTVFEDMAQVTMRLAMRNTTATMTPTSFITITRYRVTFRRADGRNGAGTDVPYGFDGAMTFTVGAEPVRASFTLVRIQSKSEAPLLALVGGGGALVISTLADVTFYGTDQAGKDVTVTAQISVNFADWGDPE